jgi:hypothetical protein
MEEANVDGLKGGEHLRVEEPQPAGTPIPRLGRRPVLRTLGLGLITGAADDDPSAIGTHAAAGAVLQSFPLFVFYWACRGDFNIGGNRAARIAAAIQESPPSARSRGNVYLALSNRRQLFVSFGLFVRYLLRLCRPYQHLG